jgi:L-methionine (R)-S-oxide reductase
MQQFSLSSYSAPKPNNCLFLNNIQMETKEIKYDRLLPQIKALIDHRCSEIANYANTAAAIQNEFKHWWCGFYFVNAKNQLELGPFQGPVACTLIDFNKGVCGTAWARKEAIVVANVHEFEGHIACSSESNSEIVVPIIKNGVVYAVLDIDSTEYNTFDAIDEKYLIQIAELLAAC